MSEGTAGASRDGATRRPAPAREPTPTTPCSVVWYDGHPWVLDGEPGIASMRVWVGMRRNGQVGWMGQKAMEQYKPAVIYRDPGEHGP